jgi:cholesterol transport system auxiliary component
MSARLPPRRTGFVALGALLALLGGCGGFLPEPPQRQLYRLNPPLALANALPRVAAQLVVATPTATGGLDTERIALSRAPRSLDYFAGVEWSERLPLLVETALVQGFEKSAAVSGVAPEGRGLRADLVLDVAIRNFEAVYDSPGAPPRVLVSLYARLVRSPEQRILSQTSFSRGQAVSVNAVPDIMGAFDRALGEAVADIVSWTLGNPALSKTRPLR